MCKGNEHLGGGQLKLGVGGLDKPRWAILEWFIFIFRTNRPYLLFQIQLRPSLLSSGYYYNRL